MNPCLKSVLSAFALLAPLPGFAQTYTNPVLGSGNNYIADPAIIKHNGTYYVSGTTTNTSFEVRSSTNLVSWGKATTRLNFGSPDAWAPDLYHHPETGRFYMYFTRAGNCGVAESTGANPNTNYTVLNSTLVAGAIDPHLFRDDDGALYLVYSRGAGTGRQATYIRRLASPTAFAAEPEVRIRDASQPWEDGNTEGGWILKRDGVYTLMYSGDGYATDDYAIGRATAPHPLGPWTHDARNPLFTKKAPGSSGVGASTPGVIGPGHNSVTTDRYGNLWMVYLQRALSTSDWQRYVCIDPVWFDENGNLDGFLTRGVARPAPATTTPSAAPALTAGQSAAGLLGKKLYHLVARDTATNRQPGAFAATGLPPGLRINDHGIIYGTPNQTGSYTVSITATNSVGTSAAVNLAFTITDPGPQRAAEPFGGYGASLATGTPALGAGFTGDWRVVDGSGTSFGLDANSLAYDALHTSGGSLVTAGAGWTSLFADLDLSENGPLATLRDTYGDVGANGSVLYLSFLVKSSFSGGSGTAFLRFCKDGDLSANRSFDLGVSGGNLYHYSKQLTAQGSLPAPTANQTVLYVVRVDYTGARDKIRVYVNPLLGREPRVPALTLTEDGGFDRVGFRAEKAGFVIDEIRVGRNWGEVTPYTAQAPVIVAGQTFAAAVGSPFDQFVAAKYAPETFSLVGGSLPPGLGFDAETGRLAGVPTQAGAYTLTFVAINASGASASVSVAINVGAPNPPLVYEGFDYSSGPGALAGKNGGSGWTSAWSAGAHDIDTVGSVHETTPPFAPEPRALQVSGRRALLKPGVLANRALPAGLPEGTHWIGFVARSGAPKNGQAGLWLTQSGAARLFLGQRNGSGSWGLERSGGAGATRAVSYAGDSTFLVAKLVLKPGVDDVYLWTDPDPATTPLDSAATALLGVTDFGVDGVRLESSLPAGSVLEFDELRVGSSYAQIAPVAPPVLPTFAVPVIAPGQSAPGTVGLAFSYLVQASNTPSSWTLSSGALPPGLALDPVTGEITGVPSQAGVFQPVLVAANAGGSSAPQSLTLTIEEPAAAGASFAFDGTQADFNNAFLETVSAGTPAWAAAGVTAAAGVGGSGALVTSTSEQAALLDQPWSWAAGETYTLSVMFKARVSAGTVPGGNGLRLGFADDATGTFGGLEYVAAGIISGGGDQTQLALVSRQSGTVTAAGPFVGPLVDNHWYELVATFTKGATAGSFEVVIALKGWGSDGLTGGSTLATSAPLAATGLTNVYNSAGVYAGFRAANYNPGGGVRALDDFELVAP